MSAPPREVAVSIVRALRGAGHVAYLAGGCVRDELLGRQPKDYDVATDAPPDRIASLFKRTRGVGKAFGVMHVQLQGVTVEVATFRKEHGYSDGRRPDSVTYTSAEEDAHRRDFTINALFIDPLATAQMVQGVRVEGSVIDFVNGLSDMRQRVVRAVGNPEARLAEDNLRALRAVRFSARLIFSLDICTANAISLHAGELAGVSRERIGDEVRLMLRDPSRAAAAAKMELLGLDAPVLTESARGPCPLNVLDSLEGEVEFSTALAAWAIDRAAPTLPPKEAVSRLRRALCLSNDESDDLRDRLAGVGTLVRDWPSMGVAPRKRAAGAKWFGDALRLVEGIDPAAARSVRASVDVLAQTPGGIAPPPLVNGDDLVAAGIGPGKGFGGWLDAVYDAQLEGRIATKEEALTMAIRLSASG
jgi:poly(A) polymerase